MKTTRKNFIKNLSIAAASPSIMSTFHYKEMELLSKDNFKVNAEPEDEEYWNMISKKYFSFSKEFINLENGYFGIQANSVKEAFNIHSERLNQDLSKFARKDYPEIFKNVKKEVASFLQVEDEEIILTRNATESLNIAIQSYPFKPNDEVLLSQLDYFSMIETFQMLEKRNKLKIKTIELPLVPSTEDEIVNIYSNSITNNTKVILLTQVSNINGLIIPVEKIAKFAKGKGIDIICDSAHALGQIPFDLNKMNCDFVGMNLHKWIGNPIGAGVLYIKKIRVQEMNSFWGDVKASDNDINKLAHFGTTSFPIMSTIPDSISFHKKLGLENISNRLHYLKSIWVNAYQNHSTIKVITPASQNLSCAIASFQIKNKKPTEVADYLWNQHKIFVASRTLGTEGCIRVTPSIYNAAQDVQQLVIALNKLEA